MPNNNLSTNTKSVSRTLSILLTFTEDTPIQRVSTIASQLGMNASTVSRHLTTLLDAGFIERDEETGSYHLGLNVIAMAGVALCNNSLYRYGQAELLDLTSKYGLHFHLSVPNGADMVHLIGLCGTESLEFPVPMGHRHPQFCSAMGRAYLSTFPIEQVSSFLDSIYLVPYTSKTKLNKEDILEDIKLTKKRGYSLIEDELTMGKTSIGVPIFGRSRKAVAAISYTIDTFNTEVREKEVHLTNRMRIAANRISGKIGFTIR